MDFSNNLSNSCSDSTLPCSTSSFDSKAYSEDTDEEMDKEINFNAELYQYELGEDDGEESEESSSEEESDIYKGRLDNMLQNGKGGIKNGRDWCFMHYRA